MDLAGVDLPVTLVIKAPNQRVGDQTVECMLGWTVRKLKEHLKAVYPSKPKETHQKLIYSGKLLADHMTLKEVLRQFEDGSNKHTVHLVCAASPQQSDNRHKDHSQSPQSSKSGHSRSSMNHSRESSNGSGSETEGLRYRGHSNTTTSQSSNSQSPQPQNVFSPYLGQPQNFTDYPGGVMPPELSMMFGGSPEAGIIYSPEQYMWMQQMYAQYMAQYMQYYQQGMYPSPPGTPATPTTEQPANPDVGDNQQEAPMNPVGGADMDDDDEFGQRDWLDWVYTLCRFMVLMGIVYFYSNFTRFFLVFAFFFIVYLYQTGWFRFQRHRRQAPAHQQQQQEEQNPQENQQENVEQQDTDTPNPRDTTEEQNQPPPEPPGPGVIQVTWTFFSTFFTSLIPQPPPAVNAN